MQYYYVFLFPVIIFIINKFILNKKLLNSYSGERHQRFTTKFNVPLSGGLFLGIGFVLIFNSNFIVFNIFLLMILILGICSDSLIIKSPTNRFFLQIFIVFLFVIITDLQINYTRIIFLDYILKSNIINYIFVALCILIIINGTNFIDGLNTLVLGYYLIITFIIFKLGFFEIYDFQEYQIIIWISLIFFLFLFNLFNKLYIGDSGAYVLGFIYSFILITAFLKDPKISPFFILLLLWYPGFENLFSIIRKNQFNRSPILPDQRHFHQLFFYYIKTKFKTKNIIANSLSPQIINIYNLIIFFAASKYMSNTQIQILFIFLNIFIYSFFYSKLFNFRFKKEK